LIVISLVVHVDSTAYSAAFVTKQRTQGKQQSVAKSDSNILSAVDQWSYGTFDLYIFEYRG
jgi:hypothetical protein